MKVVCNAVGGPADCDHEEEADTVEELADKIGKHGNSHPEVKEAMEKMSEEEKATWMKKVEEEAE